VIFIFSLKNIEDLTLFCKNIRLVEHIKSIYKIYEQNTLIDIIINNVGTEKNITIFLSNFSESFQQIYFFYWDEIDEKTQVYNHFSIPFPYLEIILKQRKFFSIYKKIDL